MATDKIQLVFAERKIALQLAATCGLSVVHEKVALRGYQIYVVEQWVCDRKEPYKVIKAFTGDNDHVIQVAVIAISSAELQNPRPEIQSVLNLNVHLKSKPTPLGEISVTASSQLPFSTVLIPDGDYDKWVNRIYVNINLIRTNCIGRIALNLDPPSATPIEKFRSYYKIADSVNFEEAVINLVSLVQTALYLFNLLDKDNIDGLICNETNEALWKFYQNYSPVKSPEFTLKEPWMEPHLVAAIISKLIMCRNKLQDFNFTTLKDPFADYDSFRFNIGDYQRHKSMKVTKFIDLETLSKLNEYTFSQLKVAKVIKSKLDDISGITNSPLFMETSDPETFKHHATIDSLRTIWRPKLKGNSLTMSSTNHSGTYVDQPSNELKHILKKTAKSGAAALDVFNRVPWSLSWINTNDHHKSGSKSSTNTNTPSSISSNSSLQPFQLQNSEIVDTQNQSNITTNSSNASASMNSSQLIIDTQSSIRPSRKPSPLSVQANSSNSSNISTPATNNHMKPTEEQIAMNMKTKQALSPDHLDQDIPSYVQPVQPNNVLPARNMSIPTPLPALRRAQSIETTSPNSVLANIEQEDAMLYLTPTKSQRTLRHTRSVSDSGVELLEHLFAQALNKPEGSNHSRIESLRVAFNKYRPTRTSILRKRSKSISDINDKQTESYQESLDTKEESSSSSAPAMINIEDSRPIAHMNVQTYLKYEKLYQQKKQLQKTYQEIKALANVYERTAKQLKETYETRLVEFERIQNDSRQVIDDQADSERRLKYVEDHSAKLHYELKVLNDKLKDIEDNVGTFYGKVGVLEKKMDDSQQSITTMLIIGNYFHHYWIKVHEWWTTWVVSNNKKKE